MANADDVLNILTELDNRELCTTLDYMAGVIAFRVSEAGLNLTYPPTFDQAKDFNVEFLIRRAANFTWHTQRQIENIRSLADDPWPMRHISR